jgi:hypothetical protein
MNVRKIRGVAICAAALTVLASCGRSPEPVPITIGEIESHIRFLSDDLLEGRAVGSRGIEMAARYHEDYFRTWGLEPAFESGYRQTFPLKGATPEPNASLEILGPEVRLTPMILDDFVIHSEREGLPAESAGDLVYAGFLIQAPEREWDDIKGVDLRGKVLLVEVNEPGNRPGGIFDGEDMTYYGRWPYKFEKAGELGAAGVLIIHETKGAAYGWEVVRNSWSQESFFLPEKDPKLFFQGWISGPTADGIFAAAGLDRKVLRARAETPEFAPVSLGCGPASAKSPSFARSRASTSPGSSGPGIRTPGTG